MKEKPIMFSDPMVRAILEGKKTQTRRIIRGQNDMEFDINDPHFGPYWLPYATKVRCPYGNPGDRLWVRETHRYWWPDWQDPGTHPCSCRYRADGAVDALPVEWDEGSQFLTPEDAGLDQEPVRWRSPIFMPRWASRITLEITDVRTERLQQISDADALAEGCSSADMRSGDSLASVYAKLWESIHGTGSWEINPFVWVVEFCKAQ